MPMMTSQIVKSVDFTETQKCRYLERGTWFFLQIKKFISYTSKATSFQKNSFVGEVTFNGAKKISLGICQNYLVLIPVEKYIK